MLVEAYCRKCSKSFDGHWHNFPGGKRMCPYCKTEDRQLIRINTDESDDFNFDQEED